MGRKKTKKRRGVLEGKSHIQGSRHRLKTSNLHLKLDWASVMAAAVVDLLQVVLLNLDYGCCSCDEEMKHVLFQEKEALA